MKKILSLVLAVMMLGTVCCALTEEAQSAPVYKTIGDALNAARAAAGEEGGVICGSMTGEYVSVIFQGNDQTDDRDLRRGRLRADDCSRGVKSRNNGNGR